MRATWCLREVVVGCDVAVVCEQLLGSGNGELVWAPGTYLASRTVGSQWKAEQRALSSGRLAKSGCGDIVLRVGKFVGYAGEKWRLC